MSPRLTFATTGRVLAQLRHDRRTIALIVLVPCLVLGLLAWMFSGTPVVDQFGPLFLGLFPLIVMFLVTSVATLRERTSGTLERLMTLPLGKADFVAGYAIAFALLATVQGLVLVAFAVWVCGMEVAGPLWRIIVVAVLAGILGCTLGLAASSLARSEFQAVQLMPAVLFPQLLLCGLVMPRELMPEVLEWISRALPMTYVLEAVRHAAAGAPAQDSWGAVVVVVAFILGAVALGAATLRRRTA